MLWTCGADFKYFEVAYLRLRTSRITKLRTCGCGFKNPETSLRTCGCGLRKLKFGYGFADYGLKKNLRCPEQVTGNTVIYLELLVPQKFIKKSIFLGLAILTSLLYSFVCSCDCMHKAIDRSEISNYTNADLSFLGSANKLFITLAGI